MKLPAIALLVLALPAMAVDTFPFANVVSDPLHGCGPGEQAQRLNGHDKPEPHHGAVRIGGSLQAFTEAPPNVATPW